MIAALLVSTVLGQVAAPYCYTPPARNAVPMAWMYADGGNVSWRDATIAGEVPRSCADEVDAGYSSGVYDESRLEHRHMGLFLGAAMRERSVVCVVAVDADAGEMHRDCFRVVPVSPERGPSVFEFHDRCGAARFPDVYLEYSSPGEPCSGFPLLSAELDAGQAPAAPADAGVLWLVDTSQPVWSSVVDGGESPWVSQPEWPVFVVSDSKGRTLFEVDDNGDITVSGSLTVKDAPNSSGPVTIEHTEAESRRHADRLAFGAALAVLALAMFLVGLIRVRR